MPQLPAGASFRRGEQWAVSAAQRGRARRTPVQGGRRSGLRAPILSRLAEGEQVIAHPGDRLADRVRVRRRRGEDWVRKTEGEAMIGVIRLLGVIGAIMLGGLGVLAALGILPGEALQDWGIRLMLVLGILVLVAVVVSLLMGSREGK